MVALFSLKCYDRDQRAELLLPRLHCLVESEYLENWTYGSFWQLSFSPSRDSILSFGDGHYKGPRGSDFIEREHTQTAEHQLHRRKVLRDLQEESASFAVDVTTISVSDKEWFFLVSMAQLFAQGVGTLGQALKSGEHVWLEEADKASNQVCTRAHIAKVFKVDSSAETIFEIAEMPI